MHELIELPPDECRRLLASRRVGRLAVNRRGRGPLVVPVVYAVDRDGAVLLRSFPGTKLARISRGAVAFQVDDTDEDGGSGWSVLVDGLAHECDAAAATAAGLDPLVPGPRAHAVRIVPTAITGRRLVRPEG